MRHGASPEQVNDGQLVDSLVLEDALFRKLVLDVACGTVVGKNLVHMLEGPSIRDINREVAGGVPLEKTVCRTHLVDYLTGQSLEFGIVDKCDSGGDSA